MRIDLVLENIPKVGFYDEIEIERSLVIDNLKAEFRRKSDLFTEKSLLYL
jgi:hypothetical protein